MTLTKEQTLTLREVLKARLAHGNAEIVFEKANGDIRVIKGTRDKDLIPGAHNATPTTRSEPDDAVAIYEVEKKQWRSFRLDTLISVNGLKAEQLLKLVA